MKLEIVPQGEAWIKRAKKNLTDLYEKQAAGLHSLMRMISDAIRFSVCNKM